MQQLKWFDRAFHHGSGPHILPATLERLAGTPLRLIDKLSRLEDDELLRRPADGSWSIQENAGHLLDLEQLWQDRIEDILNGKTYLREYDLENGPTNAANHNDSELEDILINFTLMRRQTLDILAGLEDEQIYASALHPRLNQPLQLHQHALFVAEHDDHHLTRITFLHSAS
jgi:uncharacterized damage-inducible protein DinB